MSQQRGREKFEKYKLILSILSQVVKKIPYKTRVYIFTRLRMKQGISGMALRYIFLKSTAKAVGNNVSIHPGVYIFNLGNLSIGDNVSIHPMTYIEAKGGVNIGNDVSIAHSTTILSENHIFEDLNRPIKDQGIKFEVTNISDNVWIGAKSVILSGVSISKGSIVAAGGVVTKGFPENSIIGGVPAKVIKTRN